MWDISRIIFLRVCLLQNVKCQNRAENWDTDWLNEDFSMNENTLIIDDSNVVCYNDLLPPVELIAYDGCSGSTHKHGDSCAYTCIASPDDSWPLLSSASDLDENITLLYEMNLESNQKPPHFGLILLILKLN